MSSISTNARNALLLGALGSSAAWAHGGESIVLYPLFASVVIVVAFAMAAFWLAMGLLVGLLFSGVWARLTGRASLLYYALPTVNVLVWFLAYPLVVLVPAAFLDGSVDLSDPFRAPALYLTLVAVPALIAVGLATAAASHAWIRYRNRRRP